MWVYIYYPVVSLSSIISVIAGLIILADIFTGEPEETALPVAILYVGLEIISMALTAKSVKSDRQSAKSKSEASICFYIISNLIRIAVCSYLMYIYFLKITDTFQNPDNFFLWILSGIVGFFIKFGVGIFIGLGIMIASSKFENKYFDEGIGKFAYIRLQLAIILVAGVAAIGIPMVPSIFTL